MAEQKTKPDFVRAARAAITQLEHQRLEGYSPHEVAWVIREPLERAYAAGLAAARPAGWRVEFKHFCTADYYAASIWHYETCIMADRGGCESLDNYKSEFAPLIEALNAEVVVKEIKP